MDLWTAAAERDRQLRIVAENRPDWVDRAVEAIRQIAREQATLATCIRVLEILRESERDGAA